jgi:hypothetical protein
VKRWLVKVELRLFGRCYCAVAEGEHSGDRDSLVGLKHLSVPVPKRAWAERTANRRSQRSGNPWTVTKWTRR